MLEQGFFASVSHCICCLAMHGALACEGQDPGIWDPTSEIWSLYKYCVCAQSLSCVWFFATPRTCSFQFSSVAQSCPTLCDPMSCSTPGLPLHHQLPEFTQTHVHRVSDAIQPSHPLSPSPAPSPSQHQGLFQWVSSSHEVAKGLEFQL